MEARRTPSYNESLQHNQKHRSSLGILSFNNCKDVLARKYDGLCTINKHSYYILLQP